MITQKIWGETTALVDTPLFSAHQLAIQPYSRCSLHCHNYKHNAFHVTKGVLRVEERKESGELIRMHIMAAGDFVTVPPGVYHLFRSGRESVEAMEFYYPEQLSEDIIRKDEGSTNVTAA